MLLERMNSMISPDLIKYLICSQVSEEVARFCKRWFSLSF